jgi:hypothetical protein
MKERRECSVAVARRITAIFQRSAVPYSSRERQFHGCAA